MLLFTVFGAVDRAGSIGLIGAESHRPYNRPPLSKALWKGKPLGPFVQRRRVGRYLPPRTDSPDRGCEKQESDR